VAIGGQVIVPALSPPKQRNGEENEAIKAPLERERADVSTTQKVFPRRQSLGVMTVMSQHAEHSHASSPYDGGSAKESADVNATQLVSPTTQHRESVVSAPRPPQAMPTYDNDHFGSLRTALLDHPLYADIVSLADLRQFMEDHVFAVWDFMSLLKRLQQDMTCTRVPWFPADNALAARLINDIVIGEETDVDPDGFYVSHLDLYLRAMGDVGASTLQFDKFRSLAQVGIPVEIALVRIGVPAYVQAFVSHTMTLASSGTMEEVLAAFFYGREDIIPEMFRRLVQTLYDAKHKDNRLRHFNYYIDRHIELDGDSHGPKGRELLESLVANSPHRNELALRAACNSIKARIDFWNGTLSKLRNSRSEQTPG
jgi:hypothetical protein